MQSRCATSEQLPAFRVIARFMIVGFDVAESSHVPIGVKKLDVLRVIRRKQLHQLICPPLSGPETMIVWTTKGTMNAEQEAQARRDYRQAA